MKNETLADYLADTTNSENYTYERLNVTNTPSDGSHILNVVEGGVSTFAYTPAPSILTLRQEGKVIGDLRYTDGKLTFTGEADESAKVFFDCLIGFINANESVFKHIQ